MMKAQAYLLVLLFFLLSPFCYAQPQRQLRVIMEVAGTDTGALLGQYVKGIGDHNQDGYADVAVSAPRRYKTFVYYGGNPMSTTPALTFKGGGVIASGDFNVDGWIDLAITSWRKDTVYIYYGGAAMDTIPDQMLLAENIGDGFGDNLAVGDVNGDGYDDLVVVAPNYPYVSPWESRGKCYLYAGGTTLDSIPRAAFVGDTIRAALGWGVAVRDINHDGKSDIIVLGLNSLNPNSNFWYWYLSIFLGASDFQMIRNYYIDSRNVPGKFTERVVSFDVDGDSIADILVSKIYVFKGGSVIDTLPTYYIPPPWNDTTTFGPYPSVAGSSGGDYNRDGIHDVILQGTLGYPSAPGIFVMLGARSSPGQYAAYRVWTQCCGFTLGRPADNAGDVNGDGVDDIIVAAGDPLFLERGFFGIYSGDTTLIVGVKDSPKSLPEGYKLEQNFPNPFNPETTIEFTIPKSDFVRVKIFDIQGREVISLVNANLSAGTHRVQWDGKDLKGQTVASGAYFYLIETQHFSSGKKLIYLK